MAVITADATRLISSADDIEKLAKEANMLIDELYEKLYTINTKCWISNSANSYVESLKKDKEQNEVVINNILSYANYLKDAGIKLENIIGNGK